MKEVYLYKLSGELWGIIYGIYIYDINFQYYGWIDDENLAWFKNGKFLGNFYFSNYIIINKSQVKPISRYPKNPPSIFFNKKPIVNKIKRMRRKVPQGYSDALK